jgi:hypothetical protein
MPTLPGEVRETQVALHSSPVALSEKQFFSHSRQSVLLLGPKQVEESDSQSGSSRRSRRLIGVLPGTAAQRLAAEAIAVKVVSQCIVAFVLWPCGSMAWEYGVMSDVCEVEWW